MPVLSVTETQVVDPAGNLTDEYEITFSVAGQPGVFTVTVPKSGDPVQAARDAIGDTTGQVIAIYGL